MRPSFADKTMQTLLAHKKEVSFNDIFIKHEKKVKSIQIDLFLIKEIMNSRFKPAANRKEEYIKTFLIKKLKLGPQVSKEGHKNINIKTHRALVSCGAAMVGGGAVTRCLPRCKIF